MKKVLIISLIAILLGVIGAKYIFVGSFMSLLPWGLIGLATGIYAKNSKEAITNGALYGFLLSFVFMLTGYAGTAPILSRFPFFAILGLFGAVCGVILGSVGYLIGRKHVKK